MQLRGELMKFKVPSHVFRDRHKVCLNYLMLHILILTLLKNI